MAINLVPDPDYSGAEGIMQLHALQHELSAALHARDWVKLRRLDNSCGTLVNKVIKANRDDKEHLVVVLQELKHVYANLIESCQQEAAARAV
jgi:hypothetical protein